MSETKNLETLDFCYSKRLVADVKYELDERDYNDDELCEHLSDKADELLKMQSKSGEYEVEFRDRTFVCKIDIHEESEWRFDL